jgi:nucleotide-binding universal stress UspA family protein
VALMERKHRAPKHRVVVGLAAGDAESARTLAWAIAEARASGAELVVVHATGVRSADRAPRGATSVDRPRSMGALELVDRWAAGAVAAARSRLGEDSVRIDVRAGTPGEVLAHAAGPDDIVVIGSPPRTGWWVRGGTTSEVVTRSRCPVIVVREPYGATPDTAGAAALARRRVVVGLDGAPSEALLAFGFAFADAHGLPIAVVRAGIPIDQDTWFNDRPVAGEPAAAVELATETEPWRHRYPRVPVARAVLTGRPVDALRRAGAHCALLVIGAGSTALHPLSSTCRTLVAGADCPVAVIH